MLFSLNHWLWWHTSSFERGGGLFFCVIWTLFYLTEDCLQRVFFFPFFVFIYFTKIQRAQIDRCQFLCRLCLLLQFCSADSVYSGKAQGILFCPLNPEAICVGWKTQDLYSIRQDAPILLEPVASHANEPHVSNCLPLKCCSSWLYITLHVKNPGTGVKKLF